MIVQFIPNRYSKNLTEKEFTHEDIIKLIENPERIDKEKSPLWQFFESNSKVRDSKCFTKVSALVLDFDDKLSIYQFQEKYKKISYYLYTTYSHTKKHNKFRVIVPIKEDITYEMIHKKLLKKSLVKFFEGLDQSCFSNFHNIPIFPKDNNEDYYCFYNKAEIFSLKLIKTIYNNLEQMENLRISDLNEKKEILRKKFEGKPINYQAYQKKVRDNLENELKEIPKSTCGNRYNLLVSFTGKMTNAKYPDQTYIFDKFEIDYLVLGHTNDSRVRKMVDGIFRKRS